MQSEEKLTRFIIRTDFETGSTWLNIPPLEWYDTDPKSKSEAIHYAYRIATVYPEMKDKIFITRDVYDSYDACKNDTPSATQVAWSSWNHGFLDRWLNVSTW